MKRLAVAFIVLVAAPAQAQPPASAPAHEMTREEIDQYVREQGLIGTRIYTGLDPVAVDVLVADTHADTPLPPPCEPPVPRSPPQQPGAPTPCPAPR